MQVSNGAQNLQTDGIISKKIVLSRYFDENVFLIAGMCSKCYEEADDVKITAVNDAFIRAVKKRIGNDKVTEELHNTPPPGSQEPLWSPPRSPHDLVEESFYRNPWSLLVATIFLNKTSGVVARSYIKDFVKDFPCPEDVLKKQPRDLEPYFEKLGLNKRRAQQIWRMSDDFLHKNWRNVGELYGIGQYGEDAYRIFCLGDLDFEPRDRYLKIYQAWFKMSESREKSCHDGKSVPTNYRSIVENIFVFCL